MCARWEEFTHCVFKAVSRRVYSLGGVCGVWMYVCLCDKFGLGSAKCESCVCA